tara:strand:- start:43 stop:1662 length:1620 start_codon:yes stop_codon:yes gene_type:complete
MTSPWEEGDPSSKICLIGEAPGAYEMRAGRPFVGPAGTVLDQCLHAAGIIRRECFIVNVCDEKIKDGSKLYKPLKGLLPAAQEYIPRLHDQLRRSKANVFVPLGGLAAMALTGRGQILKWRGSVLETTLLDHAKAVPTVHPAATIRGQYIWRYFIIHDLKRVRRESRHPNIVRPSRHLIINPSFGEVVQFLEAIKEEQDQAAVDIELSYNNISCIAFAPDTNTSMCIPFKTHDGKHRWTLNEEIMIWQLIAQIMEDEKITKTGQNILFDIQVIQQLHGILTRGPIHDTMIAQQILYPDFPKGLDFLCSVHTDEPYYKDDGKIWNNPRFTVEEWDTFQRYNARDSAVCPEIWDSLYEELLDGYLDAYNFRISMFNPLQFMMTRGYKVDRDRLSETNVRLTREIAETTSKLNDISDYDFSPSSPKQCQTYFYVHKNIKPYTSRTTGKTTTDDKALQRLFATHGLEEARLVQKIRALSKLKSTYIDVGLDNDNRLRCFYSAGMTKNGRLSSSQTVFGTGLNMQNLHPDFKEFLVADEWGEQL